MLRWMPPPLLVTNVPEGIAGSCPGPGPVLKLGGVWPVVTRVFAACEGVGTVAPFGYGRGAKPLSGLGASKLSWLSTQVAVEFPCLTQGCGALGITTSRCGYVTKKNVML